MSLKKILLGAAITASSIFGINQQAQAQDQVKKDCQACDERVEQLHIQRSSHAIQDFNAFHVTNDDTTQYNFTIPKGDADWARTHDGKELQHMVLLNNQGEWQAPTDGQVYLQPTQQGDELKGLPQTTFNNQPAYLLDASQDTKLTLREVLADNGCETSTGILVTNPQEVAIKKELVYQNTPVLRSGDLDLAINQYNQEEEPAVQEEQPPQTIFTDLFGSYLVSRGSDQVNQRTTSEFPSTAQREGTVYAIGAKHVSPNIRARLQALIGEQTRVQDAEGLKIIHSSNDVRADVHRTISDGPFTLGVYGHATDLEISQGNNQTTRQQYGIGGMVGFASQNYHLAAGASTLNQNNEMRTPHVTLEQNFTGHQLDAILDVTKQLSNHWDLDARLYATQQALKGEVQNTGSFEQELRRAGANVRINYSLNPGVSLFGHVQASAASVDTKTPLYDQQATHKDAAIGGGVRITF